MISCIFYAPDFKDCTNLFYKQMHILMESGGGRDEVSLYLGMDSNWLASVQETICNWAALNDIIQFDDINMFYY